MFQFFFPREGENIILSSSFECFKDFTPHLISSFYLYCIIEIDT